ILERFFLRRVGVFELVLNLGFQLSEMRFERFVGKSFDFGVAFVDRGDKRLKFFDVAFVLGANELGDNAVKYLGCFHEWLGHFLMKGRPAGRTVHSETPAQTLYCNWLDAAEPNTVILGRAGWPPWEDRPLHEDALKLAGEGRDWCGD